MNLNDLEIFKTIYETKSLNQSAADLGYAQSNISARLKTLEKENDAIFFIRTHKGVLPTEAGRVFYSYALTVLRETSELKTTLAEEKKASVLISELLFNYLLFEGNELISLQRNKIDIKKTKEIQPALLQTEYETVISFQSIKSKDYQLLSKKEIHCAFFQSENADGSKDKLPALVNKELCCPFRQQTVSYFGEDHPVIEIDSLEGIFAVAGRGEGTVLLPDCLAKDRKLVRLNNHDIIISYSVYKRRT